MSDLELYGAEDEVGLAHEDGELSLTDQMRVDTGTRTGGHSGTWSTCGIRR